MEHDWGVQQGRLMFSEGVSSDTASSEKFTKYMYQYYIYNIFIQKLWLSKDVSFLQVTLAYCQHPNACCRSKGFSWRTSYPKRSQQLELIAFNNRKLELIAPVRREELYTALKSIDELKAPGVDGFNSCFFIKSWPVIGGDVIDVVAVIEFINWSTIYKPINCTQVTLLPKVKSPSSVKKFRPISYCTILIDCKW